MKKIKGLKNSCTETRGETIIRTENLRSAFTKDDVDEYLYKLLPGGVGEGEYS